MKEPVFFAGPEDFRAWLKKNAAREKELLVGFYNARSATKGISWPQSVDEALCFGWIDGVRRRHSDLTYTIRFTPRRPGSIWSKINVAKIAKLKKGGRMT